MKRRRAHLRCMRNRKCRAAYMKRRAAARRRACMRNKKCRARMVAAAKRRAAARKRCLRNKACRARLMKREKH